MNRNLNNSFILLISMVLVACGGSSGDGNNDNAGSEEHEHEHSTLITQQNNSTLSFLEEGTAETVTNLQANGASLLLSNAGEQAAVITAGLVQFLESHEEEEEEAHDEEEHELPELSEFSLNGTNVSVANTVGHFSVLVDGTTSFVPYTAFAEEALSLGITETAPALLLDEEHGLVLAFDGTNAVIYENSVATEDTMACEIVNSVAHIGEFAVVSCDSSNFSVKVEESETEHEVTLTDLSIGTAVEWASRAGVYVGLGADNNFYVLEENDQEALEQESSFAAPANMCDWAIDSVAAQIFVLTSTALAVHEHDGSEQVSLTLDETQTAEATCEDLVMAPANNTIFVMDNASTTFYEIDIEEDATLYHIHGRDTLSVNDVASAVIFHEVGSTEHDHDH